MIKRNEELIQELFDVYESKFGSIVNQNLVFSPGRINLLGEHVDYNDGTMLPAAIDLGIYLLYGGEPSDTIHIHSVDFDESISLDPSRPMEK